VINYISTSDAIIIKLKKGVFSVSKTDPSYKNIFAVCQNKKSTIDDLDFFIKGLEYSDDDISISYDDKTEMCEVYYNGKYYTLNFNLTQELRGLFIFGFKTVYLANFLKKCFNNPYHSFNDLINFLYSKSFCFNNDGDLIMGKDFENESARRYLRERKFDSGNRDTIRTLIKLNPADINENFMIEDYKVISSYYQSADSKLLLFTWITNEENLTGIYKDILDGHEETILNNITLEKRQIIKNKNLDNCGLALYITRTLPE